MRYDLHTVRDNPAVVCYMCGGLITGKCVHDWQEDLHYCLKCGQQKLTDELNKCRFRMDSLENLMERVQNARREREEIP